MDGARAEDRHDIELTHRVADRDPAAFDELYERYAPAAYGLAFKITGHETLAQDVVHDSFLAFWRAPEAFDSGRGSFRSFFLTLVHHRAVDTVRREERLRRRVAEVNPEPEVDEDVAEDVVRREWLVGRRRQVVAALAALSPEQRTVLELAYFRGYTQARIAEELAIPIGTVKTRTLAAMRKLHEALAEADE